MAPTFVPKSPTKVEIPMLSIAPTEVNKTKFAAVPKSICPIVKCDENIKLSVTIIWLLIFILLDVLALPKLTNDNITKVNQYLECTITDLYKLIAVFTPERC